MIQRVHGPELVEFLAQAWALALLPRTTSICCSPTPSHIRDCTPRQSPPKPTEHAGAFGRYCFDTITGIGPTTFDAAIGSVATALTAAGQVSRGSALALALCRPPGTMSRSMRSAVAATSTTQRSPRSLLRDQGADKIAIVDVDFHHGNGTQAIFYDRADVFYTSLHGHPDRCYPYFTGYADETGSGQGQGTTLNLPFGPASTEPNTRNCSMTPSAPCPTTVPTSSSSR